ncbi:short-chain dehydrogenase/reductase SDR [Coprinopsis cinerea okayama7|uniref:Short-chain dehydrogenase/reductase SDR n=1 Tax=Coprinopsis cinerea (strain Okayama-7 / 130 / ATCC MYA-4618 / FGSC 9003) TaxID=240176 RepID=A8P6Z9_COPC7|nr:short-chain dehydrogenase/reductase SDR [Coprinopsis cinerea okayama7\|eukprot:XP_001839261.1 short-chain dehydrogenase/reductase SDR [Coprinopsis cinerea okayama7\
MAPPKRTSSTLVTSFMNAIKPLNTKLGIPGITVEPDSMEGGHHASRGLTGGPYVNGSGGVGKFATGSSMFLGATSLLGKVAIVTGSGRGTGASIAKCLGEHGCSVVVNYVTDATSASSVVHHIRSQGKGGAIAVKANTATIQGGLQLIEETIKTFGRVDVVVFNSGVMESSTLDGLGEVGEEGEKSWDRAFETNVKVPLWMCKKVAPMMGPGGRIIFFSSTLTAASTVQPNALCYVATKGAIEQISRVLAKDLGSRGITVNTISVGPIDTPMFREGKSSHAISSIAKQTPSKRLGEPEDVAPLVAFLASEAARWINGQNLRCDGGYVV